MYLIVLLCSIASNTKSSPKIASILTKIRRIGMPQEAFRPTDDWPMQETYKRGLHEKLQRWGIRVAPMLKGLPEEERQPREKFFEHLVTSVERGDRLTAGVVEAVDGYVRSYVEGPGPYGRGGSIESTAGYNMCQAQFEGLYAIFEAGRQAANA
jgi:hypothetical protein